MPIKKLTRISMKNNISGVAKIAVIALVLIAIVAVIIVVTKYSRKSDESFSGIQDAFIQFESLTDDFLTGNPQITWFKTVYRRHTNFSTECIVQSLNGGPPSATDGARLNSIISRNGDLVKGMHFEFELDGAPTISGAGNALFEYVEVEIGDQRIDKHYGEWMNIWTELSMPDGKREGYDKMVGNLPFLTNGGTDYKDQNPIGKRFYVPLQFWFCRNPGLALPLISLKHHDVKINIKLNNTNKIRASSERTISIKNFNLYADYVYLDTDERKRFSQESHEYLIEQVQFTGAESVTNNTSNKFRINFNHPVKELIWVVRSDDANHPFDFRSIPSTSSAYTPTSAKLQSNISDTLDTFSTCKLQLYGYDRFSERNADYFRIYQNYDHHTRVPRTITFGNDLHGDRGQYIYTYSFALFPEEHQPSGTYNFSSINNNMKMKMKMKGGPIVPNTETPKMATPTAPRTEDFGMGGNLILNGISIQGEGKLLVYAVNYNILRIQLGMGGLAFSN
tara:strand:+ start:12534 stop:14054 length:1521 start_codon:yes stop_codon:yes gene_type:complete